MLSRVCGSFLLFGFLALSAGCGPDYKARAVVQGKVTIGDNHLTAGSVMFHGKDNLTGMASIDKNGAYVMKDAPLGDVTVTVSVPPPPQGGTERMKMGPMTKEKDGKSVDPSGSGKTISIMSEMPGKIVPIPPRYAEPGTSGLTYTVKRGEHTHDIPLTP